MKRLALRLVLITLLLLSLPAMAAAVQVCVSTAAHPDTICADIPLETPFTFDVGGYSVPLRINVFGGYHCPGGTVCGPAPCAEGLGTTWVLFVSSPTAPPGGWYDVSVALPAEVCDCYPSTITATEVLSGCGSTTFRIRGFEVGGLNARIHHLQPPPPLPNPDVSLPLHAVLTSLGPCEIPDPCQPGPPLVNVPSGAQVSIYLLARNYVTLPGLQTAFDWGSGWSHLGGLWDCQLGQVVAFAPHEPGGPEAGTLTTVFDCVAGGVSTVIGRMQFLSGATGCVRQVGSALPDGTHVIDCDTPTVTTPVVPERRGSICIGQGGVDACMPLSTPLEPVSWGRIKRAYR